MQPLHRLTLSVFADYHQFYIWDPVLSGQIAPDDYTDADIANRVKIAEGVVVVQPVRNMTVPVEVSIWPAEPDVHYADWQHCATAPLKVQSGQIQIHECTGSALANITVPSGDYIVRCLFRGLDTLSPNGLDGQDFYSIQLWPGHSSALTIIKAWAEPSA